MELRVLVDERPTYGYRRLTALLNRARRKAGLANVNHKRIYRLMSQHGLLLQRYTGRPPDRAHDGVIRTIHPNARWTSEWLPEPLLGSSRSCGVLAGHLRSEGDQQCAGTGAISGEMIRDLMLQSVEQRFKSTAALHPVQWLSDNGSCYRAYETVEFAVRLGLVPCFTPPRSPQSNGMAEVFVKTLKRDYVRVSECTTSASVLSKIAGWFEDYNKNHPHRELQMSSSAVINNPRRVRFDGGNSTQRKWPLGVSAECLVLQS